MLTGAVHIARHYGHRRFGNTQTSTHRLAGPDPQRCHRFAEPEFATVLGMVMYGHRARTARGVQDDNWSSKLKAMLVGKGHKYY
jgi:hypothetical protein